MVETKKAKVEKPKTTLAVSLTVSIADFKGLKPNEIREKLWTVLAKAGYQKPTTKSGMKTGIHQSVAKMDIDTQKAVTKLLKEKGLIE